MGGAFGLAMGDADTCEIKGQEDFLRIKSVSCCDAGTRVLDVRHGEQGVGNG